MNEWTNGERPMGRSLWFSQDLGELRSRLKEESKRLLINAQARGFEALWSITINDRLVRECLELASLKTEPKSIGIFEGQPKWGEPQISLALKDFQSCLPDWVGKSDLSFIPQTPEFLFVPALACDRLGRRIGRGRGYYDRYLKANPNLLLRVGVIHSAFVADAFSDAFVQPFDQPIDLILTEKGLETIKRNPS
jgi:5-formyltetrahydrofolate cyclo-ligase